jgi:predicted NBD/HSP70 family sugar kinase
LDALAQAIGSALTLINPPIVVLSGGALRQAWFDLEALERRIADFTYPGVARTPLVLSDVADPNLRGAALLAREVL